MKAKYLLLALPLCLLGCKKKERRQIEYALHPHAGYSTYGTALFTEGPEGSNQTSVYISLGNLTPGVTYMAHIHEQDTSKYGGSAIVLNFGSFMSTNTGGYQLWEEWDKPFDEVLTYDGCIAVHNPVVGVALGNIGSNAQ